MKSSKLDILRNEILIIAKKYLVNDGWNSKLFKTISNNSKYEYEKIISLFPNNYNDLLKFYFSQLNDEMSNDYMKLDSIPNKTHEKIKKIILLRLKIYKDEKNMIRKTYFKLTNPSKSKIASSLLYKTVDQMWYIIGDKSYDFNFYSKRVILATIYSSTVLNFLNNDFDLKRTEEFLDKQLLKVSKIPNIKRKLSKIKDLASRPFIFFINATQSKR